MSEPVSAPIVPVASGPCCARREEASAAKCVLCSRAVCANCRVAVNDQLTCASCRDQIVAELQQEASAPAMPRAIFAGIAAAIVSGLGWALIVGVTGAEVGYAAVGVGWLAGQAVYRASGLRKGRPLQKLAVACAALGLVLGKYFTFIHIAKTNIPALAAISYFDPRFILFFGNLLPKIVEPFDAIWLLIALNMAWRVPRPTELKLTDGRDSAPAPTPAGG